MYSSGHWNFFWTLELFFSEHRNILLWRLEMFFILNIRNVFFSERWKCPSLNILNVFLWTLEMFFSEHWNCSSLNIGIILWRLEMFFLFWTLEMYISEHWKCSSLNIGNVQWRWNVHYADCRNHPGWSRGTFQSLLLPAIYPLRLKFKVSSKEFITGQTYHYICQGQFFCWKKSFHFHPLCRVRPMRGNHIFCKNSAC